MHDFHLADLIYKTIIESAEKNNLQKITSAEIDLGSIVEHGEEVLPANLIFNIKMLAHGGKADSLTVKINKIPGTSWILKTIDGE